MLIPVMAAPSASFATMVANTPARATTWFHRALVALWDAGVRSGIDPFVLAGQCGHETGWGNFGGAVTPDMGNTCGLKVRNAKGDRREDHANFGLDPYGFPLVGAQAHADHLRLYCGFPVNLASTPDPRAVWVGPATANFGSVVYVQDLGGKWAPSLTYGDRVAVAVGTLTA